MSFAFTVMMLLGCLAVHGFNLQPSIEEPATSADSRCPGESLQLIRKSLLRDLNLQAEPQLPAGALDAVRQQLQSILKTKAHEATNAATLGGDSHSSITSEVFMTDLGWDNWVIYPPRLRMARCGLCNPELNICDPQVPCCQPISFRTVPIVYADEFGHVVISSVNLASSCDCGPVKE